MDGDRAIAKILKGEGVEWMAAFPYQTLIDAAAQEGIRPIVCRHELPRALITSMALQRLPPPTAEGLHY